MINKTAKRIRRILLMVPIVLKSEGVEIEDLCEKLGASPDEIISDLDVLWYCGVPDYGPSDLIDKRIEDGRVFLQSAEYFGRPLRITRDEAISLIVAARALIRAKVMEEDGPVGTALKKLDGLLPGEDRDRASEAAERINIEFDAYPGHCWSVIEEAIKKGRTLNIEYFSYSRGEVTSREVDPDSLVTSRGNWYLLAKCRQAGETRLFRLDRIKDISITGNKREELAVEESDLSLLAGEYKPGARDHLVRLSFLGREGRKLAEEWPTARFEKGEGEEFTVELKTKNLAWLSTYLLRFGDRFRIESPEELRSMVQEKARQLLELY